MRLNDDILLRKIKKAHTYFDKRSKEKATGLINEKYKLSGNVLLEIYTFFVLTTDKDACKRLLTLCIHQEDWEQKNPNYLNDEYSYCDITKYDVLNKDIILKKMRDRRNGFIFVAKLCNSKFKKLEKLYNNIRKYSQYVGKRISKETREIIAPAIFEKSAKEKVKELDLT